MDAILVIAYSYTGTSRRLAQMLCAEEGWPLGEVVEARPRSGSTGSLRCVVDSLLRRKPAVRYQGPDPANFRTVVLVAPIWMYRLASPMRSFIASRRESLHRVAVVMTMGSAGAVNAISEVRELLGHAPILTAAFTARQVDEGSCAQRLHDFAEALQPGRAHEAVQRPLEWSPSST